MLEVLANMLKLGMYPRKDSSSINYLSLWTVNWYDQEQKDTTERRDSKAKTQKGQTFLHLGPERYILFINFTNAYANKKSNCKAERKNKKTSY